MCKLGMVLREECLHPSSQFYMPESYPTGWNGMGTSGISTTPVILEAQGFMPYGLQHSNPHCKPYHSWARFQQWQSPEPGTLQVWQYIRDRVRFFAQRWGASIFISNAHRKEKSESLRPAVTWQILAILACKLFASQIGRYCKSAKYLWGLKLEFASASNTRRVIYEILLYGRHNP